MSIAQVWLVVIFSLLIIGGVSLLVGKPVKEVIKNLLDLHPCEVFFNRVFIVGLALAGGIGLLESNPHLAFGNAENAVERSFMELVWRSADELTVLCWLMLMVLFVYLVLISLLTAVLNRRRT